MAEGDRTDLDRLASALGRFLRSDPPQADDRGFVLLRDLPEPLERELGRPISPDELREVARRGKRFQLEGDLVRARPKGAPPSAPVPTPDILYHACTAELVEHYLAGGTLRALDDRPIFLSDDESQAWRTAHRLGGTPRVLFVDTARQRRRRLRLHRNRRGLYVARQVALADVLNLQPNFAEQLSAGGIPVIRGEDGRPRMALIRVTRRSGVTWEVAKGKLEPGEPPEWAGVREVREEMGIPDVDFDVRGLVGLVRYGFLAPGGLPRLKTIFLYLLEPKGEMAGAAFSPSAREGVKDVRWFTPDEACRVVTHTSLRPMMRRARRMVEGS